MGPGDRAIEATGPSTVSHRSGRTKAHQSQGMPKGPSRVGKALLKSVSGCVLLSHTVTSAVPSALKGLASGFGMEPGVSPSL